MLFNPKEWVQNAGASIWKLAIELIVLPNDQQPTSRTARFPRTAHLSASHPRSLFDTKPRLLHHCQSISSSSVLIYTITTFACSATASNNKQISSTIMPSQSGTDVSSFDMQHLIESVWQAALRQLNLGSSEVVLSSDAGKILGHHGVNAIADRFR